MKSTRRTGLSLTVLLVFIGMTGVRFTPAAGSETHARHAAKNCIGYTIIEFGKAIDCRGDTIRLIKVNGGQEQLKTDFPPDKSFAAR